MSTKLALYNQALLVIGAERLLDITEEREVRFRLDDIYDLGAVRHTLKYAAPDFARRTAHLTSPAASTSGGFKYSHSLPDDFLSILTDGENNQQIYQDECLDVSLRRFLREGSTIVADHADIYLRYVADVQDISEWSPEYVRLVAAYMGMELAQRMSPQHYETAKATYDALAQQSLYEANKAETHLRPRKSESEINASWLPVYNDALNILGASHLSGIDEDSPLRVRLDVARNALAIESILETTGWNWAITSRKLTQNTRLETEWGYRFTHEKPDDMHRFDGIFSDEYMRCPVKDYQDEHRNIHCNLNEIYIKYVSKEFLYNPATWPAYFRRLVAAKLAYDVRNTPEAEQEQIDKANVEREYMMRKDEAENVDAQQSPPQVIHTGSWVRSRYRGRDNYNSGRR